MTDLTHLIHPAMTVYPGTSPPVLEKKCTLETDGFVEHRLEMTTHTGTHVDAPAHLLTQGKTLDQFPVEKFSGKAVCIACIDRKEIDIDFLTLFERKISTVEFVLFYTGWQDKWGDASYFEGFPVLTPEAALWLSRFPLKGVGLDTISADPASSVELPNHRLLLEKEILIYENLVHLDQLPEEGFIFYGIPLNLEKSDASPVRAFALELFHDQ